MFNFYECPRCGRVVQDLTGEGSLSCGSPSCIRRFNAETPSPVDMPIEMNPIKDPEGKTTEEILINILKIRLPQQR
jgi:hypothetical protein